MLYCPYGTLQPKYDADVLQEVFKRRKKIKKLYKYMFNQGYLSPDNRYKEDTIENITELKRAYIKNREHLNTKVSDKQITTFDIIRENFKWMSILDYFDITKDYFSKLLWWEAYVINNIWRYGRD